MGFNTPGLGLRTLEHFGDQRSNWRALGSGEGHVGKERVALERFHHRDHTIVATDAQVIALGHVMGENYT
jgi:hypothetical protein